MSPLYFCLLPIISHSLTLSLSLSLPLYARRIATIQGIIQPENTILIILLQAREYKGDRWSYISKIVKEITK